MQTSTKPKRGEEIALSVADLFAFLEAKPLFYDEIDYDRMPRIYDRVQNKLPKPKIIHLVGTNGKGTTGRFLAFALYRLGFKTGHYTSPHILRFNERIWIDGDDVDDASLQNAHQKLQKLLTPKESEELSYFEYTTLLAMLCFERCDYVVLEAGLGGEHDATAVFPKELTILTPVDRDHEAFLGESIEEIATTKLGAMAQKLLLTTQKHPQVYTIAREIAKKRGSEVFKIEALLTQEEKEKLASFAQEEKLPEYLKQNLYNAASALKLLGYEIDPEGFRDARLFGRLTPLLPNVLIDVGHNPLAASSIVSALKGRKFVLIYNSFKDKDYKTILSIVKPIVKRVEIIEIDQKRVESRAKLQRALNDLKIQYSKFEKIERDENYLVFGSFSVVEEFLKRVDA